MSENRSGGPAASTDATTASASPECADTLGKDDAVQDEALMQQALDAAILGVRGANPLVGAMLVSEAGDVLSIGHHRGAGTHHAERDALERFRRDHPGGSDLSTATLYSTLEPCRHQGRQPACTELIIDAGVGRVVHGASDPSSNGGGAEVLRRAGIDVVSGVLAQQCQALNHRWVTAARQSRPFVTAHLAQTMDGRIAAEDGTSQWITSKAARDHTHQVRSRADAILVGTNTVAVDDPRLTARTPSGELSLRQPLRVVMGMTPARPGLQLTQGLPEGDGWVQLRTRDPLTALQELAQTTHGGYPVKHVLVEGGQSVLSAFFAADLVDEVFAYQAPLLLGTGRGSVGDIGVRTLSEAPRFALDPAEGGPVQIMDSDVCVHLQPKGDTCSPES
ncbi:bifunctional diaminohydroxyphosphoribosylaminopyrimidine deaminase/5-amino-6-(5-phosphoribosylamino)uracil reductase RibD [Nesterenkonia jeotgali]|uniref:Riboflavin biosynthesis protein RibD n=2 Tax=Nesterenkonia jeotgali TaxID=317018 RepID=A0A839FMI9_9MICC|nr:bifunctional diaminohydroxyphosphoribosylaminopyrimidine deaminase/5-amino-6-(5-phosphoribosylamino)uracil reductase RibD [Nesterenkonia jeotgali]MBA8921116.1 diaminohydroxyphosphoribosylaminopyrimidine deaminase/5-amino-6-(5-phosphoribosylamino)uracil reductase [Nesterenkonia jeotgali]